MSDFRGCRPLQSMASGWTGERGPHALFRVAEDDGRVPVCATAVVMRAQSAWAMLQKALTAILTRVQVLLQHCHLNFE